MPRNNVIEIKQTLIMVYLMKSMLITVNYTWPIFLIYNFTNISCFRICQRILYRISYKKVTRQIIFDKSIRLNNLSSFIKLLDWVILLNNNKAFIDEQKTIKSKRSISFKHRKDSKHEKHGPFHSSEAKISYRAQRWCK